MPNYIEIIPVTIKVMNAKPNDLVTVDIQRKEAAEVFIALAELQRLDDPQAVADFFTTSTALGNEDLYVNMTIGGETFNSRPVTLGETNNAARYTTTIQFMFEDGIKETLMSMLRKATVPQHHVELDQRFTVNVGTIFDDVDHHRHYEYQVFLRRSGGGAEVVVAGEPSDYKRHLLGNVVAEGMEGVSGEFLFVVGGLDIREVYKEDPLVETIVKHLLAHPECLPLLLGQKRDVAADAK
jgi:hypothetical protein